MTDATFWTKLAPKYARNPIGDQAAYDHTLGRTRSYLGPKDKVLELGCGTGSTALLLAPHVGHVTATDYAPGMIEIAQAKPTEATNITFAVQQDVPETGQYDAVLAFNLFHLVQDIDAQFRAIHALLPVGGYFISKTACLNSGWKWRLAGMAIPMMRLFGKAPYVNRLSIQGLEGAITDAGFDIVESGTFPDPARYIVARKRAA